MVMDGVDIYVVPEPVWAQDDNVMFIDICFLIGFIISAVGGVLTLVADFDGLVEGVIESLNNFDIFFSKNRIEAVSDVIEAEIAGVWVHGSHCQSAASRLPVSAVGFRH